MFKKYEPNKAGKDFVVGDIHGCFSDLEERLTEIGFDKYKDRLFSVGDLTDRGPESPKALEYIKKDWFIPVMGNHERMVQQVYEEGEPRYWHYGNGGKWVGGISSSWMEEYLEEIKKLPLVIQVGDFGILHSICPTNSWDDLITNLKKYKDLILWERDRSVINREVEGVHCIFAGHTIHDEVTAWGNVIDIDTGAFLEHWEGYDGKLTIVEMKHE